MTAREVLELIEKNQGTPWNLGAREELTTCAQIELTTMKTARAAWHEKRG